jgi:hypothetical protein
MYSNYRTVHVIKVVDIANINDDSLIKNLLTKILICMKLKSYKYVFNAIEHVIKNSPNTEEIISSTSRGTIHQFNESVSLTDQEVKILNDVGKVEIFIGVTKQQIPLCFIRQTKAQRFTSLFFCIFKEDRLKYLNVNLTFDINSFSPNKTLESIIMDEPQDEQAFESKLDSFMEICQTVLNFIGYDTLMIQHNATLESFYEIPNVIEPQSWMSWLWSFVSRSK